MPGGPTAIALAPADAAAIARRWPHAAVLAFDAETLMAAGACGLEAQAATDALGAAEPGYIETLTRATREFSAFTATSDGSQPSALGAVRYRHHRWIARALAPALVASRAPGELVSAIDPASIRAGHLLDGQPAEAMERTLATVALGARDPAARFEIEPSPASTPLAERVEPRPLERDAVLFIAGPVELGFMRQAAEAWNRTGGAESLIVTKAPSEPALRVRTIVEAELIGPRRDNAGESVALEPLLDTASDETRQLLWMNPGLAGHWAFLLGPYAAAMRSNIERWRRLLEGGRVRAVVAAYPCVALDVAAALGAPAVLLPHGPMVTAEDELYASIHPSVRIGAIGEPHRRRLIDRGVDPARVRLTGLPRPGLEAKPDVEPIADALILTCEPCRPSSLGGPPRIAPDREIETLRALGAAARSRGWSLRHRPHPRYDRSEAFYRETLGAGVARSVGADRPSLAADVVSARAVIALSGPTSAILDASRLGRPVLIAAEPWAFSTPAQWGLDRWPVYARTGDLIDAVDRCRRESTEARRLASRTAKAIRGFDGACDDPLLEIPRLIAGAIESGSQHDPHDA